MDDRKLGFPKEERLLNRKDFLQIYARGEKLHTPHFVLYISKNNLPRHRLGITVSRKIGKAVIRNRVKRLLREIFRTHRETIPSGWDLVINVKRAAAEASHQELRADFRAALADWVGQGRRS